MDGMILLLCFLSWPAQAAAKWYIDKHLFDCCNQVEFRLRELGVEYEIPLKIEPYFDYPALLIRLSENHLAYDREGWLLASKLKVFHGWMAAGALRFSWYPQQGSSFIRWCMGSEFVGVVAEFHFEPWQQLGQIGR